MTYRSLGTVAEIDLDSGFTLLDFGTIVDGTRRRLVLELLSCLVERS